MKHYTAPVPGTLNTHRVHLGSTARSRGVKDIYQRSNLQWYFVGGGGPSGGYATKEAAAAAAIQDWKRS